MYHAPSVVYPTGRFAVLGGLLVAVVALQLALQVAWWQESGEWRAVHGGVLGLSLLLWAAAWRAWWHAPRGQLRWRDQAWDWQADGGAAAAPRPLSGPLSVHLDWQAGMLLCLHPPQGVRQWLWVERRHAPQRWDALRRAVYSRPSAAEAVPVTLPPVPHSAKPPTE